MSRAQVSEDQGVTPFERPPTGLATHSPSPSVRGLWSKETYIAILALVGIFAHLTARYGFHASHAQANWPLFLTLIAGAPLIWELVVKAFHKEFGSDLLAGISITASILLGEYLEIGRAHV